MPKTKKRTANGLTLLNMCTQYKKYKLESPPLPRYDIISPYVPISDTNSTLQFTQQQLDMRRKVEILKYNQQSSKTNNPSKSQTWSFLNSQISHTKVCRENPYIQTSTSACDVPGPPMNLFFDPTVPLYNYISNREAIHDFSSSQQANTWDYYIYEHAEFLNKKLNTCFDILYNGTKNGKTNYAFKTPVSINVQGKKNINSSALFKSVHEIEIQLTNIKCVPYYSSSPSLSLSNVSIKMPAFNFKIVLPQGGGDFSATKYIGNLSASNLTLYTEYQYVYDIKLSFDIVTTLYDSDGNVITTQNDLELYVNEVISNIVDETDDYYYNTFNCEFVDPNVSPFVDFSIESDPPNATVFITYGSLQN